MTPNQNSLMRLFADGRVHGLVDVMYAKKWATGKARLVIRECVEAGLITATDGGWRKQ